MDYGRLFLFMTAATAVMAFVTHLWCWAYRGVERMVFRRKLSELCQELGRERLEDDEIDRRRLLAPRYMTWEQAMIDFRGGVPIDDILDRLNGEFPPRASEIQHGSPFPPSASSAAPIGIPELVTVCGIVAIYACLFGIGFKPVGMEFLIQKTREKFGGNAQPPPPSKDGPTGFPGTPGPTGAIGPSGPTGMPIG